MKKTYDSAVQKAIMYGQQLFSPSHSQARFEDVLDVLFTDNPALFTTLRPTKNTSWTGSKSFYTSNREFFEIVKASVLAEEVKTFYRLNEKNLDLFNPLIVTNNRISDQFCKLFYSKKSAVEIINMYSRK
jgi:hypothetical protein